MSKYPQEVIEDLLQHLDALDVLELIDYHPESMQRTGDIIKAYDPISQDLSGRYLTVNLKTRGFESTPPNMPRQTGNIIELYARIKYMSLDQAVKELADEFGVLLRGGDSGEFNRETLLKEARQSMAKGEKEGSAKSADVREAEKRVRALLQHNAQDLDAQRLLFRIRLLEGNPLTLVPVTLELMRLEKEAENFSACVEVGEKHLKVSPNDLLVRLDLADGYAGVGEKKKAVEELMRLADFAETANQFELALQAYRKVREVGGEEIDVYPLILELLLARGNQKEALAEVNGRVQFLRETGKLREACDEALRRLQLAPNDDKGRMEIVDLCVSAGLDDELLDHALEQVDYFQEKDQLEKATEALTYISAEQPDNLLVLESLISLYKRMGMDEMVVELQIRMADQHRRNDNAPEAYLIMEELLASQPHDQRLLKYMSDMLLQDNALKEAVITLDRLAKLQVESGEVEEAAATYHRIWKADPSQVDAREREFALLLRLERREQLADRLEGIAPVLIQQGLQGRLAEHVDRALAVAPEDVALLQKAAKIFRDSKQERRAREVQTQLMRVLTQSDDMATAEDTVRGLLGKDPGNPSLLSALAEIQQKQNRPKEAAKTLRRLAEKLRGEDRLAEARQALERLSTLEPEDMEILSQLSDLCTELGDDAGLVSVAEREIAIRQKEKNHKAVMEQAEMILELRPKHVEARRALMEAAHAMGDDERAVEAGLALLDIYRAQRARGHEQQLLRELAELLPDRDDLALQLLLSLASTGDQTEMLERLNGFIAHRKKDPESAIRVLRDLHRELPDMIEIQRRLVKLYDAAGRHDDMVAEMQRLIEAQESIGNKDEAIRLYRELLEKASDSVSTRAGLINLLRETKRIPEAVEEYLQLARLLHRIRKLQEAAQAYEEILTLTPESEDALRGLAELLLDMDRPSEYVRRLRELAGLYARQGKMEKAVVTLNDVLERDPANQEVRRDIIRLKRDGGKLDEALEELRLLADSLSDEGDFEGAVATRREMISIKPNEPALREDLILQLKEGGRSDEALVEQLELADVYAQTKKFEVGLEVLENVLQADPGNLQARRVRAKIFDDMGDEKRALEEYRVLQKDLEKVALQAAPVAVSAPPRPQEAFDFGLEILPEYDFETFVVGSKNNFASATARAVAEHPGSARNPLFLYSDVGLGKTHLLHAIANHLKKVKPSIRIMYTSTEYFTSELIDAIQNNTVTQFRNKHRQSDVLLLDDVQFLAGKERSQEEFFHIFNMLYQARRQIVVTSDRPPKDISHLDMRLRSRFGQGVIVDIQPPDVETRIAILRADMNRRKIEVPQETLAVIAERITTNVRELKGAFNQLVTQHEIGGDPLNPETASAIVEKYFGG